MCGLGLALVGLIEGSYWDVSRDLINPGWVTRAQEMGMMCNRPETLMSTGNITDDTSQVHPRDVFLTHSFYIFIVTHRNSLCDNQVQSGDHRRDG